MLSVPISGSGNLPQITGVSGCTSVGGRFVEMVLMFVVDGRLI